MSSDAARPKQSREFDPISFTVGHHEGLRTYASATFSGPQAAHLLAGGFKRRMLQSVWRWETAPVG
jgi:hypothetical protein